MKKVAVIILNRNLPQATDQLYEKFQSFNNGELDVFVVESGSDHDKLSRYCTWWADWDEARQMGLRYPRGFNYGLLQLKRTGRFSDYDYFFMVCNDIWFDDPIVAILLEEMERHPRLGIISPCGRNWGERTLIGENQTRYVWHVNHLAWLVRRRFVETIMERATPTYMNLFYDGTNYRGYYADQEVIIKGYINEFATAISSKAMMIEKTELLRTQADLIRTEPYEINIRQVFDEGREWVYRKYGFTTRAHMQLYAQMFFDRFFHLYPHLTEYRL
ncbi:MAG: hypothetical protein HQL37_07540 [Alphaproteobacteria bacterium]|nr:hypothetical protein [Alphaproteobacteria bacterium]